MSNSTYITMQGDAWDSIAYRLWGEERLFMDLLKANPDHLDTVIFPAGVTLSVPDKPRIAARLELPPWRK